MTDLRYPIGKFSMPDRVTEELRQGWINDISKTPAQLRTAVAGLTDDQLDTPYRPEGWTIRQVVHHLPDSHMNAYVRFKLALTEDQPTIKTYAEEKWAELSEAKSAPVGVSLALLESLHSRWEIMLRGLTAADYDRAFRHPDQGLVRLERNLAIYAWHGKHHIAQITTTRERKGWI